MGLAGELFKYQVRVDDKNENTKLEYTLLKGPHGMQMDRYGKILWVPKAAQINNNTFEVATLYLHECPVNPTGFGLDIIVGALFTNIFARCTSVP